MNGNKLPLREADVFSDAEAFLHHYDHGEADAVDSSEAIDLVRDLLAIAKRTQQPEDAPSPNIPEMQAERERMLATLAVSLVALVPGDAEPVGWLVGTGHAQNALADLDALTGTTIRVAEQYWTDLTEDRDYHCRRANEYYEQLERAKQASDDLLAMKHRAEVQLADAERDGDHDAVNRLRIVLRGSCCE